MNFAVTTPDDVDLIETIEVKQPMAGAELTQSTSDSTIWSYGPIKAGTTDMYLQIQVTLYCMLTANSDLFVRPVLRCILWKLIKLMIFIHASLPFWVQLEN